MADHKFDLRTAGTLWREVAAHLADDEQEEAGALLVRYRPGDQVSTLVAERWRPVPDQYVTSRDDGLVWDGRFNLRLADEAAETGLGVVVVHRHGGPWPPRLSRTDRERGRAVLRFLRRRCPSAVHGLLVVASTGVAGWLETPVGGTIGWREIRIAGSRVEVLPARRKNPIPDEHDRQLLAFGPQGIRAIATSSVGVVGLSGGGSHVAQQLLHAGVGELVGVDPQLVEESNLRRLVGAYRSDIGKQKVDVVRRMARRIASGVRVVGVTEEFPSARSLEVLRRVDVLIGCVDGWDVRDDLNTFALEHRIPYVDIGAVVTPPAEGSGVRVSGQIAVVLPDGPC